MMLYLCLAWIGLTCFVSSTNAQTVAKRDSFAVLDQFSASVQALAARVSPSVVQISVTKFVPRDEVGGGRTGLVLGRQQAIGSGVIIDPDGYIVTNAHVVSGAQSIHVHMLPKSAPDNPDKTDQTINSALAEPFLPAIDATLIGIFKEADLALLKIAATGLPALPFADYGNLRQGQIVFAFGSREGLSNSVSMGVVSSVARQPDPDSPFVYIQTDAPINPGDSGGPLVNTAGEVVGVDTFILTQSGGSEGVEFAIPSPLIKVVCDQLRKQGHFHRLVMGLGVQTITPPLAGALRLPRNSGVVISDVVPGGPGDAAGLKLNDIVLAADGGATENLPKFMMALLMHQVGQPVKLRILRGDETLSFRVAAVEEHHSSDGISSLVNLEKGQIARLGILGISVDKQLQGMFPDLRRTYGVVVAAKSDASDGTTTGLQVGDVIHETNGVMVTDVDALRKAINAVKRGDPVALLIEREGKLQYLSFEMQ